MNQVAAKNFTTEWIKAWNEHDLEKILNHYSDKIKFYSPFIQQLNFNNTGIISDKSELRKYFEIGLKAYPYLVFEYRNMFIGINILVIYYKSSKNRLSAEVFELNEDGQAVKVFCNSTKEPTS